MLHAPRHGASNLDVVLIERPGSGGAKATAFDTERNYDYVTIDGHQYSGSGGALAPYAAGVAVSDGERIAWHTDGSYTLSGWELCVDTSPSPSPTGEAPGDDAPPTLASGVATATGPAAKGGARKRRSGNK